MYFIQHTTIQNISGGEDKILSAPSKALGHLALFSIYFSLLSPNLISNLINLMVILYHPLDGPVLGAC